MENVKEEQNFLDCFKDSSMVDKELQTDCTLFFGMGIGAEAYKGINMQSGFSVATQIECFKTEDTVGCQTCTETYSKKVQTSKKLLIASTTDVVAKKRISHWTAQTQPPIENFVESLKKNDKKYIFYTGLDFSTIMVIFTFFGTACHNLTSIIQISAVYFTFNNDNCYMHFMYE